MVVPPRYSVTGFAKSVRQNLKIANHSQLFTWHRTIPVGFWSEIEESNVQHFGLK
jgi:hypothetical protein